MEIFAMTRIYAATVAAIFVTTSLATNVLVVGTRGPLTPGMSTRLRSTSRRLGRRTKRVVDSWVVAMLSRRERQASTWLLPTMSDRELRDIGLHRIRVGRGDNAGHMSPADARTAFAVAHPLEEGLQ
jgi:uncharacterized protein YjiS (DUF1127 family)